MLANFLVFKQNYISMTERIKQKYCIEFCKKLDDSRAESTRKIERVFREKALKSTRIKEWCNHSKGGSMSADRESRSGRPFTCRKEEVSNVDIFPLKILIM